MCDKFTWTQEYRRTWEEEKSEVGDRTMSKKSVNTPYKKNLIRHMLVLVDASVSIEKPEFIPTVRHHVTKLLPVFIEQFRALNPLSIMSFATCKDVFTRYSKTFTPGTLLNTVGDGAFSFLNALQTAISVLKRSKYSRECLIITASISTKDGGSYTEVLDLIRKYNIKINIISICGEVTLFQRTTSITNGRFVVPLNLNHFEVLLEEFAYPLPSTEKVLPLVRVGFPSKYSIPSLCACHLAFHHILYECPNCGGLVCELPTQCYICEIQLVSPVDFLRACHFLHPMKPLVSGTGTCSSCGDPAFKSCSECSASYCFKCAEFVSDNLSFCVFCPLS